MLPLKVIISAWIIWAIFLFIALVKIRKKWRGMQPVAVHLFFATVIILTLLAMMRVGTARGLDIHLLGLTSATLMMRQHLALLASVFSHLLLWILGRQALLTFGIDGVTEGIIPIYTTVIFAQLLRRFLAPNPFIFTLGAGFFGGILSLSATMLATALLLWTTGLHPWDVVWHKYLEFLPVIIYPEGFVNGVFTTAMVAFYPNLLAEFDPKRYFKEKP